MNRIVTGIVVTLLLVPILSYAQNPTSRYYLVISPQGSSSQPLIVLQGSTVHFSAKAFEALPNTPPREISVSNLQWAVSPASFGTITAAGDFTPSGSSSTMFISQGDIIASAAAFGMRMTASVHAVLGTPPGSTIPCTISGIVTDMQANPISGADVLVVPGTATSVSVTARTDASGRYVLKVPAGRWYLRASAGGFLPEFYNDAIDYVNAAPVVVDSTQPNATGIDFAMSRGGEMTGTVISKADNTPIARVTVTATNLQLGSPSTAQPPYVAFTDGSGRYSFSDLPAGLYRVQAKASGFDLAFYFDKTDPVSADPVRVQRDSLTTGIDFHMVKSVIITPATYAISGFVKGANGTPVSMATVVAWNPLSMQPLPNRYATQTGNDGSYRLNVPGGPYVVQAQAKGYLTEYYDNSRKPDSATLVTVNATTPQRTDIHFTLDQGGSIAGRVISASTQQPLADAIVSVVSPNQAPADGTSLSASARTDQNGDYVITGLATGDCIVMAAKSGYQPQYYLNASQPGQATKVSVQENRQASGIDFALSALPGISGSVTDGATQAPIAAADISVSGGGRTYSARSDASGAWRIAVPAGTYVVRASAVKYATEWYNEKSTAQTADNVVVSTTEVAGIDFTLDKWGGSISGIIRSGSGSPLANATVMVQMQATSSTTVSARFFTTTRTLQDGSYKVDGLPAGSYLVAARATGHLMRYYHGAATPQAATPVALQTNQAATGINIDLPLGGSISGIVLDAKTNAPIPYAFVSALGNTVTSAAGTGSRTDSLGRYVINGLATGDYRVYASAFRYAGEYYDNVRDPKLATAVSVTAPLTVSNIDFTLDAMTGRVRFAGTLSDAASSVVPPHCVIEAVDPKSGALVSTTTTNVRGEFEIFSEGGAVIRARAFGYAGQYAGQTMNWQESLTPAGGSGINFSLQPCDEFGFGTVTGHVTDADSRAGLSDAWIFGTDGDGRVYFATTDSDGNFAIAGTPNGPLTVSVSGVGYLSAENAVTARDNSATTSMQLRRADATLDAQPASSPSRLALAQNYPNPFSVSGSSTRIAFTLPASARVRVVVYDLLGHLVATLLDEVRPAGAHSLNWKPIGVPAGIYLVKLEAGSNVVTRRMTLLK